MQKRVINIGKQAASIDVSPAFNVYSRVIIHVDSEHAYTAGDTSGRTLEIDNPLGTQSMANGLLAQLRGMQYQPWEAASALLDPAAEIGDPVSTASSYGGLYRRVKRFGRLMLTDAAAPSDEEINHEFQFVSAQERKFERVTGDLRASLIMTNTLIRTEVIDRQSADSELSSRIEQTAKAISAEVIDRQSADSELSGRIELTATSLSTEIAERKEGEVLLGSRITQTAASIASEISDRRSADNVLSSRIAQTAGEIRSEVARASAVEGSLESRISQTDSKVQIEITRATTQEGLLQSSINATADQIEAKVSKQGGGNRPSSFSWSLNDTGHRWYANGEPMPVMAITASGLKVRGHGEFSSGTIGGFAIGASELSYNGLKWGDTTKNYGAYIGQSGIQLGKYFSVDTAGNLKTTNTEADTMTATNIRLKGTLTFYDEDGNVAGTMSASNFLTGASQSYNNYSGWTRAKTLWDDAQNDDVGVGYMKMSSLRVVNSIQLGDYKFVRSSRTFRDGEGNTVSLDFWAPQKVY